MPTVTSALLRDFEERASALLGDEYARLVAVRARGIGSKTPPKHPHRLVNNLRRLAASREAMERGRGPIDVSAVVEVGLLLELLERWRRDENWPVIVSDLVDPKSYAHMMVLLAAEKTWSDLGHLVVMERASSDRRSFDLRLLLAGGQSMALEVKAPVRLHQYSARPLSHEEARQVVSNAIDSADPSKGGQLPPDLCGQLVIGGFGLKQREMKSLDRAAAELFKRRRQLSHIAAIVILSLGVHVEDLHVVDGTPVLAAETKAQSSVAVELCRNPWYLGRVPLTEGVPKGWFSLGPLTEMGPHDHPDLQRYR